jgi:hypothetical protein
VYWVNAAETDETFYRESGMRYLILAAGRVSNSVAENLDVLKRLLESPIAER